MAATVVAEQPGRSLSRAQADPGDAQQRGKYEFFHGVWFLLKGRPGRTPPATILLMAGARPMSTQL